MSVRIDKWLWAARFFKTRTRAREAIAGGKVHLNGQRTRPARKLAVGDRLEITRGFDETVVIVRELSEQRGPASLARLLYEETPESLAARALRTEQRRAAGRQVASAGRLTKKDRRLIHRFRDRNLEGRTGE